MNAFPSSAFCGRRVGMPRGKVTAEMMVATGVTAQLCKKNLVVQTLASFCHSIMLVKKTQHIWLSIKRALNITRVNNMKGKGGMKAPEPPLAAPHDALRSTQAAAKLHGSCKSLSFGDPRQGCSHVDTLEGSPSIWEFLTVFPMQLFRCITIIPS